MRGNITTGIRENTTPLQRVPPNNQREIRSNPVHRQQESLRRYTVTSLYTSRVMGCDVR